MKPAAFDYHAPRSLEEAAALLGEWGDEAKVLAGGQSLVPMLAMRLAVFPQLVDVGRIAELSGVAVEPASVRVGATTVDAEIERRADVGAAVPLLSRVTPLIGHFQIRNRGTVGGSIAHADPAAEYPAVALALDAEMSAASSRGTRTIPASSFFTGLWSTALEADELLTGVRFPVWSGRCGYGVAEFARRHGDFALAGAVAAVEMSDRGTVARAAVALFGMGATAVRAVRLEEEVTGRPAGECDASEIGRLAVEGLEEVTSDTQGTADYRRQVAAAMVSRAWRSATEEATGASAEGEEGADSE